MQRTIFYSWQADLPNRTNRGFIQKALEEAAIAVAAELTVEAVIDRDTQGVPGSPDITKTILAKITASDVFVADVTPVAATPKGKPLPNPNVLLELGYALHGLGEDRVVLVMNTAYGDIDAQPFDLKMRRTVPYEVTEEGAEKAAERKRLSATLKDAIVAALKTPGNAAVARDARFEQPALDLLSKHAGFYKRVLRLIDEISQLPNHYLTIAKPPEYEEQRKTLHARFNDDYDVFECDVTQAEDRLRHTNAETNQELLTGSRDLRRTVETLVRWSNERILPIELRTLADKKYNAEEAAKRLTALTLDRFRNSPR